MVDETEMGAVSVVVFLLLLLCPVFIRVHASEVFHEYTSFFSWSKARPSGLRAINVSISVSSKSMAWAMWYSLILFRSLTLFQPAPGGRISCKPIYSKILYRPHSACASGLRAKGKCHQGCEALFSSVEDFRIENISSLQIPWFMAIRGSCRTRQ